MNENKMAFLSGKLNGTKTLKNEFNSIEDPDLYEEFLKDYINLKMEIDESNEIIYINDDKEFKSNLKKIEDSEYISLCINNEYDKIYITIEEKKMYVLDTNNINTILISNLVSKEKPTKFSLNSFPFFKWCNERNIDIRNIYDIPTYIKILTNNIEIDNSYEYYIEKYTDKKLLDSDEKNKVIIGNFIREFGKYLEKYIEKFELTSMCRIINENSYYESIKNNIEEDVQMKFSYTNLNDVINELINKDKEEFKNRKYILSPLGRIALKFGKNEEELLKEIYIEDIETLILNEFYNNNVHVKLLSSNLYKATCKFKNAGSVFSLTTAILSDVFYRLFGEKVKIKIECDIEE